MLAVLQIPTVWLCRTRGQSIPPSCGRVNHPLLKQEEPIAVIQNAIVAPIAGVLPASADGGADRKSVRVVIRVDGAQEVEPAADGTGRGGVGGAGEELREQVVVQVDEETGDGEREQVGAEEATAVDGVAPGPADAAEEGVNDAAWPLSQTASPESAVRAEVASLQTM